MKKILIVLFTAVLAFSLSAQVDREELESINYSGVEFRNYVGPHSKIDTLAEIFGIGTTLAARDSQGVGRYFDKYRIIHVFDPQETQRLNADIFILEPNAGVDHIDNVRRIIAGYLMEAYGYSSNDALVLARFVSYYNAVFRGNIAYFREQYIPGVAAHLDPAKVGIATRYEEWPGNTQMVIPLSHRPGQAGPALSTDTLTHPEVIESLREQEDRGLDERKDMTDIKESEIQQEEQAIQETRRDIQEREEELAQERQDVAQREKEIEEKEAAQPGDEAAAREREQLESDKEELAQKEEELTQDKEDLAQREEQQDQRLEQIKEEREQIARDEQELLAQEESRKEDQAQAGQTQAAVRTAPFLLLADGTDILGTLILVDTGTGDPVKTSGVTNIRGAGYYGYRNNFLVVAGEESGERIISLVLLDSNSLEPVSSGSVSVAGNSHVLIQGNDVYACVRYNNRWVPGRFNASLELTGVLDRTMAPFSFLSIQDNSLFFQDERGKVQIVPLSEIKAP